MAKYALKNTVQRLPIYKTRYASKGTSRVMNRRRTGLKTINLDLADWARYKNIPVEDIEYFQTNKVYAEVYEPTIEDFEKIYPEEFGKLVENPDKDFEEIFGE